MAKLCKTTAPFMFQTTEAIIGDSGGLIIAMRLMRWWGNATVGKIVFDGTSEEYSDERFDDARGVRLNFGLEGQGKVSPKDGTDLA
jgi:hypothetical protein